MAASASSTTPISPRSPRRATEAGPGLDVRGRRWRRRGPQSVMPNSFQHPPIGTGEARSGKPPLQTENGLDSRTDRHSDVGRSENRHLQVVRAESRSALGGADKFGSRPLLGFSTQLLPVGMRRQSSHSGLDDIAGISIWRHHADERLCLHMLHLALVILCGLMTDWILYSRLAGLLAGQYSSNDGYLNFLFPRIILTVFSLTLMGYSRSGGDACLPEFIIGLLLFFVSNFHGVYRFYRGDDIG